MHREAWYRRTPIHLGMVLMALLSTLERGFADLDRRWRLVRSTKDSGMETLEKVIIAGIAVAIALAAGTLLWSAYNKHAGPLR